MLSGFNKIADLSIIKRVLEVDVPDAEEDQQEVLISFAEQEDRIQINITSDNPKRLRSVVNGTLVDLNMVLKTMKAFPTV